MKKHKKANRILWYETVGFFAAIALSWLNELAGLSHFLFGGAPSTNWQTVTLKRGLESIGDAANAAGTRVSGKGYAGNDTVSVQVSGLVLTR